MAPQQCRSDRESRWSPLRQLAAALGDVDEHRVINRAGTRVVALYRLPVNRSNWTRRRKEFPAIRRHANPVCVRVDSAFDESQRSLIDTIVRESDLNVTYSALEPVATAPEAVIESTSALVVRAEGLDRVRWLSNEVAPSVELLQHGISVDRRVLVQRGDIEMARWILEQSVSITHHRYGNVNADPNRSARTRASVLEG